MFFRRTPPIRGPGFATLPGALAAIEPLELGGTTQWTLTRGVDPTAPVVLLLHDGPGAAQIGLARSRHRELERAFVVVDWDQRGSGLSWSRRLDPTSVTVDRLVEDALELSRVLAERFHRERIVLSGHGWGGLLGILAAARAPEQFESLVVGSPVVDVGESDGRMYDWAVAEAERHGARSAQAELREIGAPPFRTAAQRRAVVRRVERLSARPSPPEGPGLADLLRIDEYTVWDLSKWRRGLAFSRERLGSDAMAVELPKRVRRLEVPTYFVAGREDHVNDPSVARAYLQLLDAPRKGWAWIEGATHRVPFEEPDAYAAALAHFVHEARAPEPPAWSLAG